MIHWRTCNPRPLLWCAYDPHHSDTLMTNVTTLLHSWINNFDTHLTQNHQRNRLITQGHHSNLNIIRSHYSNTHLIQDYHSKALKTLYHHSGASITQSCHSSKHITRGYYSNTLDLRPSLQHTLTQSSSSDSYCGTLIHCNHYCSILKTFKTTDSINSWS